MKVSYWLVSVTMVTLLLFGCTVDDASDTTQVQTDPVSSVDTPGSDFEKGTGDKTDRAVSINPNRSYYDVIVMDIDRWELCMNVHRARYRVTSYTGHMWYQSGSFIFEGSLTAVYDHQQEILTVTALDSGWDRGHIVYSLKFVEGTNDLSGSFVYFEYPRRTNAIDAWLEQGTLGTHTYGTSSTEPPPFEEVDGSDVVSSAQHPKKARIERMQ